MTEPERSENVRLEVEVGNEALTAAKSLLKEGLYRSAMSRTYYGMYHYVKALLYKQGLESKSHEGLEHLFGLHWIRTGKVDVRYAKLLARLQTYRERSDYGLVTYFSKEDVELELTEVDQFLKGIRDLLK